MELKRKITKGDKVLVTNPDSSFYNKKGTVRDVRLGKVSFVRVFLPSHGGTLVFIEHDLSIINKD